MAARNIIVGQRVDSVKVERAKQLRRAMTDAETLLWTHLRCNQLERHHFRRQQVIDGFIVDFYCHSQGLVVEVDGGQHQQRRGYDAERNRVLAQRSLRVLRVTNEEVQTDVAAVLDRIARACRGET